MCTRLVVVALMLLATSAQAGVSAKLTLFNDPIVGVAATPGSPTSSLALVGTVANTNNHPAGEPPSAAIDNITAGGNKYLNFQETGTGFIVTLAGNGPGLLNAVRFSTGNDAPERDPLNIVIEGTNSPNPTSTLNSVWSPVYSGISGLAVDPGRNAFGLAIPLVPTTPGPFSGYRVLITGVRDAAAANSFQFGEIELLGVSVPEPSTLGVLSIAGLIALRRRRS